MMNWARNLPLEENGFDGWSAGGGNGQDSGQAARERLRHFIAGTLAGAAGVVVGHPFDTVKVRATVFSFSFFINLFVK
jgi:uncharacterized protein YfiM (DUF2279 family)